MSEEATPTNASAESRPATPPPAEAPISTAVVESSAANRPSTPPPSTELHTSPAATADGAAVPVTEQAKSEDVTQENVKKEPSLSSAPAPKPDRQAISSDKDASSMDIRIESAEVDENVSKTDASGLAFFTDVEAKRNADGLTPATRVGPVESTVSVSVAATLSTSDLTEEKPKEGEPTIAMEKQPVIGQLELRELLSATSMKIVEYAQKLAEAPLIGTLKDVVDAATAGQAGAGQVSVPGTDIGPHSGSGPSPAGAPSTVNVGPISGVVPDHAVGSETTGHTGASQSVGQASGAVGPSTEGQTILEKQTSLAHEDRYPGPDHPDHDRAMPHGGITIQEDDGDQEPYEAYTIPDGMGAMPDVPAVLRSFIQLYNDEKQPIAKTFKLEDEDKLNEAATWDGY